jgi:phosphoribosyl 1,2-cyclic phosphodiesterase/DNA-binding response OmpR family regulator
MRLGAMRVRFWGTRGSIASAGVSTLRYGGNTSCVEVRSDVGTVIVLDCGTGAPFLGRALLAESHAARGHLLVTHTHWDHIQGFPFFVPLFSQGNRWDIYGPRGVGNSLREALVGQMQYTYFPVTADALAADVRFHDLVEGRLELDGDVVLTAQYLNHPALCLGYRLEADGVAVVYALDHEPMAEGAAAHGHQPGASEEDDRFAAFLSGAELAILDAPYLAEDFPAKRGWGHGSVEYAVDVALAAGVRRLAFTHHDPGSDDVAVARMLDLARARVARAGSALEVMAAAEGEELALAPAAVAPETVERATPAAKRAPSALLDRSVLVAVTPESTAAVLAEAVRADGSQLFSARGGAEVLRLAREEEPSLLLVSRDLPDGNALEVCRRVRSMGAWGAEVPVVLVARHDGEVEREAGAEAGCTEWLVEPFKPTYARTRIGAWLMRAACRWVKAPLPPDEAERLRALQELRILDTPREQRFDRLTRLAATLFDVPIALVSLVDADRQWFKSHHGLDATETPREMAFCAHAILQDGVLLVRDALSDARFAENPLVTHDPRVRFYAGVPLALPDGSRAGTLCLIDHRPRDPGEAQLEALRDLGRLVERELSSGEHAPKDS